MWISRNCDLSSIVFQSFGWKWSPNCRWTASRLCGVGWKVEAKGVERLELIRPRLHQRCSLGGSLGTASEFVCHFLTSSWGRCSSSELRLATGGSHTLEPTLGDTKSRLEVVWQSLADHLRIACKSFENRMKMRFANHLGAVWESFEKRPRSAVRR